MVTQLIDLFLKLNFAQTKINCSCLPCRIIAHNYFLMFHSLFTTALNNKRGLHL